MAVYEDDDRSKLAWAELFPAMALTILGVRFVQGFIFWGGASRRLIYDFHDIAGVEHAVKLDFAATGFVANKMVHALPGALWIQGPMEWMLANPALLDASVWAWTIAELLDGLGLIFGLMTRVLALASVGLNVALMLIFGWMGSTCLDEWTMAVSGVAMSAAVVIAGGGKLSLDHALFGRITRTAGRSWITWLTSGTLHPRATRRLGIALALVCLIFTVGSYDVLFGAVVSPLHSRVNFHRHDIALTNVVLTGDGVVELEAYVDAGPDTGAAYVIAVTLRDAAGTIALRWDGDALAALPESAIACLRG
jgi:thiosulfate dehydrogenase [quinone] large subunit